MEYSIRLRELYEQMKADRFYSNPNYLLSIGIEKRVALGVDEKTMAAVTVLYSDHGKPDFLLCFIVLLFSENNPGMGFLNRLKDIKPPITIYPGDIDAFLDNNNITFNGLKESLRKQSLPLPFQYFPGEYDNTTLFISKIFPPEYSKPGMMVKCAASDRKTIIEQLYQDSITQSIEDTSVPAAGVQGAPAVKAAPVLAMAERAVAGEHDGQERKTPAELLAMHEKDPVTWTQLTLAQKFYDGTGDRTNENTLRNWTKKQWGKAKKERAGDGRK